jgi:hypothetical protein
MPTIKEVSAAWGISMSRIRQLVVTGRIAGQKVGRDWIIPQAVADNYVRRPSGRPRRVKQEAANA